MSLAQSVASVLARYGAEYTIRKANTGAGANAWTAGASVPSYSTCRAAERRHEPADVAGGASEATVALVVDAGTLVVTPEKGDRIALGTFTGDAGVEWLQIVNAYPVREGNRARVWRLECSK